MSEGAGGAAAKRFRRRVTLEYVGTRYAGWQVQPGRRTVQETLQNVLQRLAGEPVTVHGAGRTDAGVHALGQVAHFDFADRESIPDLQIALNALLPADIRVRRLSTVAATFNAQRDARRKRYEYRIYNGRVLSPFLDHRACLVRQPLDAARMDQAARRVEGRHDFTSFAAARTRVRSRIRTVTLSRVSKRGRHLTYRIEGDGFLHHMVRNLAGTLIDVGLGRMEPQEIRRLLEARDRTQAGPTAPAEGLYLVRIWY